MIEITPQAQLILAAVFLIVVAGLAAYYDDSGKPKDDTGI